MKTLKFTLVALIAMSFVAMPAFADGAATYTAKCKMCHGATGEKNFADVRQASVMRRKTLRVNFAISRNTIMPIALTTRTMDRSMIIAMAIGRDSKSATWRVSIISHLNPARRPT